MKHYRSSLRLPKVFCAAFFTGVVFVASGGVSSAEQASPLPPPSPGIAIGSPPPAGGIAAAPASSAIPAPPPSATIPADTATPPSSATLTTDAAQLASQAEQTALQAQAKYESEQAKKDREHLEKSYNRAAMGLLPLAPDEIREFMRRMEHTDEAADPPASGAPKGMVRMATLSLDPGVEPPQLNLSAGYVTTITFVDATGAPWPIMDVGIGGNFEVVPSDFDKHVVRIIPLTRRGEGDLSIILKEESTPIIFRLKAAHDTVDLRYDARIPKMGPGAQVPLINRPPPIEAGSTDIIRILQNDPPQGAKRMKISGLDARTMAWTMDNRVFVRTPLTLLSPAWNASVSAGDGTKVYEIGDAPVLLMSDNGAMIRGRIVQEDDHD